MGQHAWACNALQQLGWMKPILGYSNKTVTEVQRECERCVQEEERKVWTVTVKHTVTRTSHVRRCPQMCPVCTANDLIDARPLNDVTPPPH